MTSRDTTLLLQHLNSHCAVALEAAASLCGSRLSDEITVEHWMLKLLEAGDGDIPAILRHYGIDANAVWDALMSVIDRQPRHLRGKPALSLQLATVLSDAWGHACQDGIRQPVRSANLLQAIVDAPHVMRTRDAWPLLSLSSAQIGRLLPRLGAQSCETEDLPEVWRDVAASSPGDAPAREGSGTSMSGASPETAAKTHAESKHPTAARVNGGPAQQDALARYAIDLTDKARRGDIDPVFGRDREVQQMVDVLARRRKNNPILVGEPGVGKTALVEGLALRVVSGDVPAAVRDVRVLTLDLGLLQAGAGVKGEFEQRLKTVIQEVQASSVPVLLFIDEAHTLIGAGNAAGGADAANLLKPALARGELRTIAATTWAEYKEYFERDAALERRFQLIKVDEPDDAAACLMLRGLQKRYASFHRVHIRDEALVAAVKLSRRYIPGRQLPDKAVDLIDTACARVRMGLDAAPVELQRADAAIVALENERETLDGDARQGIPGTAARLEEIASEVMTARAHAVSLRTRYEHERALATTVLTLRQAAGETCDGPAMSRAWAALSDAQGSVPLVSAEVDAGAVARVVSEWTGVPVGNLVSDELRSLLSLETKLTSRVVGQDDAVRALTRRLRMAKAGLASDHAPLGVFLLAGPSGVGKTETALALADALFGGAAALTTINMSEYQEAHSVSQLKGAPPGYVGYGRGGVLTEAVRQRPYGIVLLDEVEKAHRDVLDMFYQVFDRGAMRDGEGREIDFRNCVILMTSNLASDEIDVLTQENPEMSQAALLDTVRPALVAHFQPALFARFETLLYRPLGTDALRSIVAMKLARVADRLAVRHNVSLTVDDALVTMLADGCLSRASGARGIDAFIDQQILPAISDELLACLASDNLPEGVALSVTTDGQLDIDFLRNCGGHNAPVAQSEVSE
ncbi:type VI secretion system ATPase TssH [Pandoraea oxalativorans]|uniref:ClpV1 family T6SS ATPase n=1 Tax=Pandoraea oxalativorans TaxID=573737 RepID=A0A0E3U5C9_9BURK|nr:type VI secretion system ATPase TssH [Pandoraea oxalativorans]AKC68523.1 ClpV1 family T6SS ATPase [Pandoraea oxalativorans]